MTDVPPQRNLPSASEPWGRAIEARLRKTHLSADISHQDTVGGNRSITATLDLLGGQLERVSGSPQTLQWESAELGEWMRTTPPEWARGAMVFGTTITNDRGGSGSIEFAVVHGQEDRFWFPPSYTAWRNPIQIVDPRNLICAFSVDPRNGPVQTRLVQNGFSDPGGWIEGDIEFHIRWFA